MNLTNNLPRIANAFIIAQEALRAAKLIIRANREVYRKPISKMPELAAKLDAATEFESTGKEVEDLFVVALWAVFERFLRDYMEYKGNALKSVTPTDFGEELHMHFVKEVEYWKPQEMLDVLKRLPGADACQLGEAKQIYEYRNWVAHGRNPCKPPSAIVMPNFAYNTLNAIVTLLLNHK